MFVTQLPLEYTTVDLWRLVTFYDVSMILMLNENVSHSIVLNQ